MSKDSKLSSLFFAASAGPPVPRQQAGASLIMVMIILTVVSMIGIAGVQISAMGERGARNDRDYQIAWQSAEAGLIDAEMDLYGPGTSTRRSVFTPQTSLISFVDGCGTSGNSQGLCSMSASGKAAWLLPDFTATGSSAPTAEYGTFTNRTFQAGSSGFQPSKKPRYVIEAIPDSFGAGSASRDQSDPSPKYVFRVTAMGFGPRDDIQAVVQMVYRN
jgi:type IV pilus assembly protein PilX